MWKYNKELSEEDKLLLCKNAKKAADNMNGNIPGLLFAELQKNVNPKEPHDLALYCEFEDFDSVVSYQTDPVHLAFKAVISGKVNDRVCIDCEKV